VVDLEEQPSVRRAAVRKPPRRKPVKRATTWVHRWLSLVLGLLLLVECTTGALLVYAPELTRWLRGDLHVAQQDAPEQPLQSSLTAAQTAYPDLAPTSVYDDHGTHTVYDFDAGRVVTVDGYTGAVLGSYNNNEPAPGAIGWTLAFADGIHLCALSCEEYPGHQAWLADEIPHSKWAGFDGAGVTWGGLVIAVLALMLVFLALSGVWLWWPTFKHFVRGVRVRFGKGRYARDYDLHQVVGMVALPLLLMWGVTGASYELGFVDRGWYAVTPGTEHEADLTVDDKATGEITADQAVASAQELLGHDAPVTELDVPAADDPAGYYAVWFSDGYDPYAKTQYPGDVAIEVDRHDAGNAVITYGGPQVGTAQVVAESFNYPVHSGFAFNGWIRILWVVFGLVPLLLAWTGVSTWLFKRSVRKRRRRAAA